MCALGLQSGYSILRTCNLFGPFSADLNWVPGSRLALGPVARSIVSVNQRLIYREYFMESAGVRYLRTSC